MAQYGIGYFVTEACFHGSETYSGFRKMSSIFQVRDICCDLLEYLFYSKFMEAGFLSLTLIDLTKFAIYSGKGETTEKDLATKIDNHALAENNLPAAVTLAKTSLSYRLPSAVVDYCYTSQSQTW